MNSTRRCRELAAPAARSPALPSLLRSLLHPGRTLSIALRWAPVLTLLACGDSGSSHARDAGPDDAAPHDDAGLPANDDPRGHGACAKYIACVREATPQATTAIIATYGDQGTCWDLPGVTAADCNLECAAQHESIQTAYPDAVACQDCTSSAQCAAGEHCVRGTCRTPGVCTTACETAADCGFDGVWQCVSGACVADGCQTSDECGGSPFLCAGYKGQRLCTVPCRQTNDCPALDVPGRCSEERDANGVGLCTWGCLEDTQCNDGFSDAPGEQPLCRQDGVCGCYDDDACGSGQKCLPVPAGPR